jgi:hypothetical protein
MYLGMLGFFVLSSYFWMQWTNGGFVIGKEEHEEPGG